MAVLIAISLSLFAVCMCSDGGYEVLPQVADEELARLNEVAQEQELDCPAIIQVEQVSLVAQGQIGFTMNMGQLRPESGDAVEAFINGHRLERELDPKNRQLILSIEASSEMSVYLELISQDGEMIANSMVYFFQIVEGVATIARVESPPKIGTLAPAHEIARRMSSDFDRQSVFQAWLSRHEVILGAEQTIEYAHAQQVSPPQMNPNGGEFEDEVLISFSCSSPHSAIFYAPSEGAAFQLYTSPFFWTKRGSTRFVIAAAASGYRDSEIVVAPEIVVKAGNLSNNFRNGPNLSLSVATRKWVPQKDGSYIVASGDREQTCAMYARYGGSLRRAGFDGEIAVGVMAESSPESPVGELVQELGIRQVGWSDYIAEGSANNISTIFWMRYFFYLGYLEANWDTYRTGNVLLSDFRDVYFQKNPFKGLDTRPPQELHIFQESFGADPAILVNKTFIGETNQYWLNACYGPEFIEKHYGNAISCSGVVIGSAHAVLAYLREMVSQFLALRRRTAVWCHSKAGSDQGVHNFLFMSNSLPSSYRLFQNNEGDVKTVGTSPTLRNHIGLVVNPDGTIPSIIHQYDRVPELNQTVSGLFPFFPYKDQLQQPLERFEA